MEINTLEYMNNLMSYDKEKSKSTSFFTFDKVYFKSNEDLFKYNLDKKSYNNVLTVTSSGDHALFSILNGASNITSFDINRMSKIYSSLKFAMIKSFDYEEFIDNLIKLNKCHEKEKYNIDDILDKVSDKLSSDEIDFWVQYNLFYKDICNLFLYSDFDFRNTPYNTKANYNKIKDRIDDVKINYIDCDIKDLDKKVSNKFDLVFLSNILDYMSYDKMIYMIKKIYKLMNDNSEINIIKFDVLDYDFKSRLKKIDVSMQKYSDESYYKFKKIK